MLVVFSSNLPGIVLREIGLPPTEFEDFGELTRIILDVIEAHREAWDEAGVLHRAVSVGNILIDPVTRSGYLIDWDESCLRSEIENGPVEPYRVGTWQFYSALTLSYPRKPYRLSDDVESFVHVFRWLVLRFHSTEIRNLRTFVDAEYESNVRSAISGIRVGGDQKLRSFSTPTSLFKVTRNDSLQGLLEQLAYNCFLHYQLIDMDLMHARYSVPHYTNPQAAQQPKPKPDHAPIPTPPRPSDDDRIKGIIAEIFDLDHDDAWSESPWQAAPPGTDACDVVGFLSDHAGLVNIFKQAVDNNTPRQADQFHLRFCEQD
ncbi:hypothetical protein GSI_12453 [Ganoderma sinense ZZ0214-1]|uniref:Fungal-type protein kinase domain-containing protein n=1 Tax=Ganoderma sinense ZZ0214-1 TaxID=1077348 RepID=A0A2G8RST2_9APHY|nr:hypothetical protein GSI_12453 [Ganoderma sinense ZZ0214-1]